MCVAPVEESKVSSEEVRAQGTPEVTVSDISARSSPCTPVKPALAKGRLAEVSCPDAIVKLVADPIVTPVALRKETVLQDAAVPLEDSVATLTTLMRAVSVLPSPNGGKVNVRVPLLEDVCANADADSVTDVKTNFLRNIFRLSLC